jgi:polyhydroxyalkanoate synthase
VRGVSKHHEDVVSFVMRQILDIYAPSNYLPTNPELLKKTFEEGGQNLWRGGQLFLEDWQRTIAGKPPVGAEKYQVGRDVAVTPGKVVFRNKLMELILYEPVTKEVQAEPVLIVPAWIMKYYILDLSPENSLVRWLVEQGHTVFMISWRNPKAEDRDLSLDDYRRLGIIAALERVGEILPERKVNTVGYCLGGTLLAIAAAKLARDKGNSINSITLLAAQTDFEESGELSLFIDQSEVSFLEDIMWEQGYLDAHQMAGAFQLLRSNDLIWSRLQRQYLAGEREGMIDLMAWNADTTRLPYRMHTEYLERIFLENDLAEGRYEVEGRPVALSDIRAPIFMVGTESDHVAPWRSVYRLNLFTDCDVTFLLTNGGHNAGIVSEPGHKNRRYRIHHRLAEDPYIDPDLWYQTVQSEEGSWWPAWNAWLKERSSGKSAPPSLEEIAAKRGPLLDAPGSYVLQR